ncbi:hypothetical protein B0T24DRAFT_610899 [Lasiosphaeria ovina]|uniref:Uncharacterized protein n=1 Tax=Lasiosphaeria ovina TaxID=92902 RepID=A0AAE0KM35_9PEZI|nr:hypothetical protein B0T24DRAFT_610899 [Lasiosphaeria ovina]
MAVAVVVAVVVVVLAVAVAVAVAVAGWVVDVAVVHDSKLPLKKFPLEMALVTPQNATQHQWQDGRDRPCGREQLLTERTDSHPP